MNRTVITICFIVTLLFAGMVSGAAKKSRKLWKKRKAASMLQTHSQGSGLRATADGEAIAQPAALARGARRQAIEKQDADAYDNYDDSANARTKGITWPRHLDDMMYYATTPLPYYTVNAILGIGYHPELTEKPICEEIYDDWLKWKHTMDLEEESDESESAEMVQMFTQVTEKES